MSHLAIGHEAKCYFVFRPSPEGASPRENQYQIPAKGQLRYYVAKPRQLHKLFLGSNENPGTCNKLVWFLLGACNKLVPRVTL
jgi:hypothetical protein